MSFLDPQQLSALAQQAGTFVGKYAEQYGKHAVEVGGKLLQEELAADRDPLDWVFARRETYGLPADPATVALLLFCIGMFLFSFMYAFEGFLKGGFFSRAIAGGVIACCLSVTVLLLGSSIYSTAQLVVIFIQSGSPAQFQSTVIHGVSWFFGGLVGTGISFLTFGKGLAIAYSP